MVESKEKVSKKVASKKKVVSGKKAAIKKRASTENEPAAPVEELIVDQTPVEEISAVQSHLKGPSAAEDAPVEETIEMEPDKPVSSRERAAASRRVLLEQLRSDWRTGKESLKTAGVAALKEFELARKVASNEITLLKEQFSTAMDREDSLLHAGKQKAEKILAAGESWGRQRLSQAKAAAEKIRGKLKK
jgi:hypothetical protein